MTKQTPKIYVACLRSSNLPELVGRWIGVDENTEPEDLAAEIKGVMISAAEVTEEYAIHDSVGFEPFSIGECISANHLCILSKIIADDDPAFCAFTEYRGLNDGDDYDDIKNAYDSSMLGVYDNLESWAEELIGELNLKIPDHIVNYIDYASYARDQENGGLIYTIDLNNGRIAVFQQ